MEFRNATWMSERNRAETLSFLEDHGLTYVAVDEPQGFPSSMPPVAAVTNDALAIVRFHGRNAENWKKPGLTAAERFDYQYTKEELAEWLGKIEHLADDADEVHVLMNNCYADKAVRHGQPRSTEPSACASAPEAWRYLDDGYIQLRPGSAAGMPRPDGLLETDFPSYFFFSRERSCRSRTRRAARSCCRSGLALSPVTAEARRSPSSTDSGRERRHRSRLGLDAAAPEQDRGASCRPTRLTSARPLGVDGAALRSLTWSKRGDLIGAADRGGTELHQLYVARTDERVEKLSWSEGERVQRLLSWNAVSPDGSRVAFSSNARQPTDMDIVVEDVERATERALVTGPAWHVVGGWSPDGSRSSSCAWRRTPIRISSSSIPTAGPRRT